MIPWRMWYLVTAVLGTCCSIILAVPVMHDTDGLPVTPAHFLIHAIFPAHQNVKDLTCLECKTVAAALDTMNAAGATVEEIEDFVISECIRFDLFPEDVCSGMVKLAAGEVLYVLNNTNYNHDTVCGWLLRGHCKNIELEPWTVEIPGNKPEPFHPEPEHPAPNTVRVLHLSDLHVDLLYDEGSAAHCQHPLCCRHAFGDPAPGEAAAGHWGALAECDIPLHTLEDLIAQAALANPDLVYVTGDLPPHDVWAQDHESNLIAIRATMSVLKQYFPETPVINALGNHASAPVNSYVVPAAYNSGWDMSWLYDSLASMWTHWLPNETLDDIRRGGFFSYSPLPGLRVISINMNFCNTLNWWLLLENKDPVGQLQWLVDTLAAAELSGEVVHLLGHIAPGLTDCDHTWSHIFNQIVVRYESTIRGMFFGHTHNDSWQILYDPVNNTRPVATAFITPSGTTNTHHNPSFRVFVMDGGHDAATWTVLDIETYNMNMTEANAEGGSPEYTLRYTAQNSYGVTSMTPSKVNQLVVDMATDENLFRKFEWNTQNSWSELPETWSCDKNCLKGRLCELVTGDSSNLGPCHHIEAIIDGVNTS